MANLPPIKWAQRKDSLFVTIDVADMTDSKIDLTETKLSFYGKSHDKEFACDLEFFAEVDPQDEDTKYSVRPRNVYFHIMKKAKEEEYWPRLLENKAFAKTNVKLDWDRYVDEDEEAGGFDTGGMDFNSMGGGMPGGMGGAGMPGGMGGMPGGMGGMPGMPGGMGGMPGMPGGMGGMGGMDMSQLMAAMGGGGGMPGGMPDLSSLGMGGEGGDGLGDMGPPGDDSDDDLPDLEPDA